MLNIIKKTLGMKLTALLIGASIFIAPKVILDNVKFYKESAQAIAKYSHDK